MAEGMHPDRQGRADRWADFDGRLAALVDAVREAERRRARAALIYALGLGVVIGVVVGIGISGGLGA